MCLCVWSILPNPPCAEIIGAILCIALLSFARPRDKLLHSHFDVHIAPTSVSIGSGGYEQAHRQRRISSRESCL